MDGISLSLSNDVGFHVLTESSFSSFLQTKRVLQFNDIEMNFEGKSSAIDLY